MEKIQECAINFQKLIDTTSYVFHLAKRKVTVVTLDFAEKDFLHASGLHYLTDLSIPKNNSIIKCDYIIESQLKGSHTIVYIFIKHRAGEDSPCCIVSFGVKKNISYGGINIYWMLKDKIVNGIRTTIFQNPKYTNEQKLKNESQNQEG